MFSSTSLSDGTGVDGRSHGAEGKDERDKSEMGLRLYRVGEEYINEVRDAGDLGSKTGSGLPPLEVWLA